MPSNQLLTLSSADLSKAATLQSRIEKLQADLAKLIGAREVSKHHATRNGRGTMPAAQREKLSRAAKARWKKAKAAGRSTL